MADGEAYSILLGDDGLPMLYPNLFVTISHRCSFDSSNTSYMAFEHIRYLYEICKFLNIDLIQRCKCGDFLSKPEMEYIVHWAKRTVSTFRQHVANHKSVNIVSFVPKLNRLETARTVIVVDRKGDISLITAYNRITNFAEYIGWLEKMFFNLDDSKTETLLKSLRPKRFNNDDEDENDADNYKSMRPHEIIRVLDVVRPDSSENPWKSVSLRYRNQLIINMLESLGCRRGELLKIRPIDVKRRAIDGRRYVQIRSNVDTDDSRLDRPEGKTLGRFNPMDKRLADMYDNYLIHHRCNANGAERIPYLFVTHNHRAPTNQALSNAAVNKICRQISGVVGFKVHPHSFRHAWNDKYSKYANQRVAAGIVTEAKSESDRQKLMGWGEGSKMAMKYSKRFEDERAFKVGMELQEKSSTEIQSIVGVYEEDITW
ncbi:site-specific integrase [Shewanella psychromarinicola]|uniref:Site-specific integrase n=1 Tax=Shewanella psychromarinicola TaxID=2487742 RepID=A0A3N4E2A1_9GAMM|nr:site-specific integrase [Shewanella psychromarinicola]AZG34585.1 site-specific integrase [Shewanella psychromarinicola]MCL1081734.1 site-specific integrase [Shewanella psychromarinicola]RPA28160.1 site-specific integrase [Shewanella psychromarinicola]